MSALGIHHDYIAGAVGLTNDHTAHELKSYNGG